MEKKILQTLEYDQIKQAIGQYLVTASGRQRLAALQPLSQQAAIQTLLDETADGADLLRLQGGIPLPELADISGAVKRLSIGAILNGSELAAITRVLRATSAVADFLDKIRETLELRRVYTLGETMAVLPGLTRRLVASVDQDTGEITDEASPEIKRIRHQITSLSQQIRTKMNDYTRGADAKYLSETLVTVRDDRYVIPVKAENRGHFRGVVHDQSASGQTLFIEPEAVVTMNNNLRAAQVAEAAEIQRVLAELTAELVPYEKELAGNAEVLGHFDFINAKARYAKALKANEPALSAEHHVRLLAARHPLIDPKKVVANDIVLGEDYDAIVVTGPNTGGKTITLKTLGLLQLMAQSGLFIPAASGSTAAVYSGIFADIGDEQSIEQSLSTFSAHMTNIVHVLGAIDADSLVLFDELGAGTDPQEGAALAIAILDAVGAVGAAVVASTHYPELKLYGYNAPRTINASMEFDGETLQPTYRLLIGIPGRSNAFDISRRLGLSGAIVEQAKSLIGSDSHDLNAMIQDLEQQRHLAETRAEKAEEHLAAAQKLHDDLAANFAKFENERDRQLEAAKRRANQIVDEASAEADKIITELRRKQLGSVKENELIEAKTDLKRLHQEELVKKNRVLRREKRKRAFQVGDTVMVTSYHQTGELLRQVDDKTWEVQMGVMRVRIDASDLEAISGQNEQKKPAARVRVRGTTSGPRATLDLRGQRYDEAMANLDRYIDAALLANYSQVTIIHGLGTGAIRNGVNAYLKRNRQVASFGYAPANAGGSGATIVQFK